jgi:hypothetical protein
MYGEQPVNFTMVAAGPVSQYHIVQASGDGVYGGLATDPVTQNLRGVAQNVTLTGDHITVCPFGISRVVAGAVVALGERITCNASGRAVPVATVPTSGWDPTNSGQVFIGQAIEAAEADGDIIMCFIKAREDKVAA